MARVAEWDAEKVTAFLGERCLTDARKSPDCVMGLDIWNSTQRAGSGSDEVKILCAPRRLAFDCLELCLTCPLLAQEGEKQIAAENIRILLKWAIQYDNTGI